MPKKIRVRYCKDCGVPRALTMLAKWNPNGTITQRVRADFRAVVVHIGFLDGLFENIESRLGLPIQHIAFEAQRNSSKAVFQTFSEKIPLSKTLKKPGFAKRRVVEMFNKVAIMMGMSYSETIEYEPGRIGIARMHNPFNLHLMAANVVGAFEFLEERPFDHSWTEESPGEYVITIHPSPEKPDVSERLQLDIQNPVPGELLYEYRRCPRCGAPEVLSNFDWIPEDGMIMDRRTDTRVMVSDGYMVTTVFRELAKELGDDVDELLVDAQREWTIKHVSMMGLTPGEKPLPPDQLMRAYRTYLQDLPVYGQGNPVSLEMLDPGISVEVQNPYETFILAGTLQGLFEALEKTGSVVKWEVKRPGVVVYTVTGA